MGNSKQTKLPSSPIKMTTQIMSSGTDDIIPAEKRIKNANVSKHGLYPHEVLILDYAGSYYTEGNSFQGFWWYKYGVKNVDNCLHSLLQCQKELNLTDAELKTAMLERMNRLSAPLHLFTPEECVEVVLMESREDTDAITKIYAKAKRRFKQSFQEIKCWVFICYYQLPVSNVVIKAIF
jgi:hypothetical protein